MKQKKRTKTPFQIVKTTNYLHLAVIVRTLYTVYGWRKKRIFDFIEAYIALMQEVFDGRSNINQLILDTEEMTGFNVKKILDEVYK